ncbi:MAG: O-antigen ligase family protein [bacterium]
MANPIEFLRQAFRSESDRKLVFLFASLSALAVAAVVVFGPWKMLGVVGSAAIIWLLLTRPEAMVMALAAYTPFEPFLLKFVPDELYVFARYLPEMLVYALLAVAVWRVLTRRRALTPTPIDLPFVFFVVVALTSLVLNAVPAVGGLLGLRQIIRFILLFFAVVYLAPRRKFVRNLTVVMFAVVVFESVLGIVQSFVGAPMDELLIPSEQRFFESIQLTGGTEQFWSPGTRIFATLGRYDQLGTFLSFFGMLAVGLLYSYRERLNRHRLTIVLAVLLPALLLTMSRASWFGFGLGLLLVGGWLLRDRRVRLGFVALVLTAVGYLAWSGLAVRYLIDRPEQTAVERLFEAFSYERWRGEYYGLGRLYWMVQTVTVVVPSSPIFGVGPGQYGGGAAAAMGNARVYQELNLPFGVYGTEGYIDNNWFSLWGETGTLGLAFYVWMLLAVGAMSWSVYRRSSDPLVRGLALGMIGGLAAITLQAGLGTYLEVRTLALYLWLFAACVCTLGQQEGIVESNRG